MYGLAVAGATGTELSAVLWAYVARKKNFTYYGRDVSDEVFSDAPILS